MDASEIHRRGNAELTTRETVTTDVTGSWLAANPHVEVTGVDLAKTLQQLITELFLTGGRRQREELSAHAVSVLEVIGLRPDQFAPVRTFAKNADMPVEYGAMIGDLMTVLLPLAAAIQLARVPVTNAAVEMLGPNDGIDRRRLRGFVVAQVRPHARGVHARVGAGVSHDAYLSMRRRSSWQRG
jgi:hypothetical protein